MRRDDVQRFWSRVAIPNGHGCMLWLAGQYGNGYGQFRLDGSPTTAHRVSLILATGPAPFDHAQAAHSCRNRHCVAPAHLRWATCAENLADRKIDGTDPRGTRNTNCRLAEEQVLEIIRRWRSGERSRVQLAAEFGVSRAAIHSVVVGRSWGWLTGIAS